jgi:NTE family protein
MHKLVNLRAGREIVPSMMGAGAKTPSRRPRIGLALGSGGARGWAHVGVLRTLSAAGVRPDVVAGTSIGALIAGVHLAGHLSTLDAWARALTRPRLLAYLDPRMSGGGLIGGQRMLAFMERYFGALKVEDLPVPFIAVATDLGTGHEVWLQEGRLAEILRTAISLPGVFTPVRRDRHWLVDGALVNPVPVSVCRAFGAELVIAVNLNADQLGRLRVTRGGRTSKVAGFEPDLVEQSRALRGRGGTVWQQMARRERNTPSLFSVMVAALNITQDRITRARLAGDPPDVTIRPDLGHIGLLEFDRATEAIEEGARAAEDAIAELRTVLASS